MTARPILQLGSPELHEVSTPLAPDDVARLAEDVRDLFDTMRAFRAEHGFGRAIAAPQIGVRRRIVAMCVDEPVTLYNPVLSAHDDELVEYWEDCMSFPGLLVRVRMPRACELTYRDADWKKHRVRLTDDYAALLQHEVDHLDGVLATQRAADDRALAFSSTRPPKDTAWRGEFRPLGEETAEAGS